MIYRRCKTLQCAVVLYKIEVYGQVNQACPACGKIGDRQEPRR